RDGAGLVARRREDHVVDLARVVLDHLNRFGERPLLGALPLRNQGLARQVDEQHNDDEREKGRTEKAIHVGAEFRVAAWIPPESWRRRALFTRSRVPVRG